MLVQSITKLVGFPVRIACVCVQAHNFCPLLLGIHQTGLLSFDRRKNGNIQDSYVWVGELYRFNQLPSAEQHSFYQGLQHYAY